MANTATINTRRTLIDSGQLSTDWLEHTHERQEHPELYALRGTGLTMLDLALGGGLEKSQLVLIGGPPKAGKTTLLLNVLKALAKQGMRTAWFGAEMNLYQTGTILFSNISRVERLKIRASNLDDGDWHRLLAAAGEIEKLPLLWNYGFTTLEDIDEAIDNIQQATGEAIEAVGLDYVQLMEAPGHGSRQEQISYISRGLKHLAMTPEAPKLVIANAQLKREDVRAEVYALASWYGSGGLEHNMDLGMIVHDVKDTVNSAVMPNVKGLNIVGSRETPWDDEPILLGYNGAVGLYYDYVQVQSQPRRGDRFQ